MKYKFNKKLSFTSLLAIAILLGFTNCERDISDDAVLATYPKTANIFTDVPVGLTDAFFESFDPAGGANPTGFGTDDDVAYIGNTSIRIDVPAPNDPDGGYIGGIFRDRGEGRDLTGYDALTFWAKGSTTASIGTVGFGVDFDENKHQVTADNIQLSTDWRKYIIPIPDPSKLTQERGMFIFSAGTQSSNGFGFTFWIDELKFEKLGTIVASQASIMSGNNVSETTFVGVNSNVEGIISTFNLPNGRNQIVNLSTSYCNFTSSNPNVATVDENGRVTSLSQGTTVITATINGVPATGSLTINCVGAFTNAPTPPTRNPANVISIFSDAYANVPVNYYNGYWAPWQTTLSSDFTVGTDNVLGYSIFNFVGIEFSSPTVNATAMTHFHLDAFIPGPVAPGRQLRVIVVDFGANGAFGGGDDTRHSTTFTAPTLVSQNWVQIDIPFSAMPGLLSKSHLAQIILEGGDNSVLYVDNMYFYN
ncbi:Ig-like domain-containing protein [Flavobacterium sp. 25HG05S-40]|uniref:Ig-like domain-containing protein n=1 Tax=Flavobacterium sp. 25HG05S-40 TaxID=3458682 RepID=UPI0040440822